ncbi:MAG TPA: phosphodiester glycosidase family protein [Bacillota bacterium]
MYAYRARPQSIDLARARGRRRRRPRALLRPYRGRWRIATNAAYTTPMTTYGLLARRGRLLESYPLDWPALVVLRRGGAFIAEQPTRRLARAAWFAVGGGPVLVRGGRPTNIPQEVARLGLTGLAPDEPLARTAVGVRPDGTVVLSAWRDATLETVAQDLIRVGVVHAMGLDGGEGTLLLSRRPGPRRPVIGRANRRVSSLLVLRRARRIR